MNRIKYNDNDVVQKNTISNTSAAFNYSNGKFKELSTDRSYNFNGD